jgi:hypothetical protein
MQNHNSWRMDFTSYSDIRMISGNSMEQRPSKANSGSTNQFPAHYGIFHYHVLKSLHTAPYPEAYKSSWDPNTLFL